MEKKIAQDVFLCSDDQAVINKLLHLGLLTKFLPTDHTIKAVCLPYIEYVRMEEETKVNAYAFFCFTHLDNVSQGDYSYVKICDIADCTNAKVMLLCELISNALGPLSRIEVQSLFPLN